MTRHGGQEVAIERRMTFSVLSPFWLFSQHSPHSSTTYHEVPEVTNIVTLEFWQFFPVSTFGGLQPSGSGAASFEYFQRVPFVFITTQVLLFLSCKVDYSLRKQPFFFALGPCGVSRKATLAGSEEGRLFSQAK